MESTLDNTTQSQLRYSDDVKEILLLADKHAKKAGRPHPLERDYLRALLVSNRAFTHQDAILKKLGLSPQQMHRQLQTRSQADSPSVSVTEKPLMHRAELYALNENPVVSSADTATVQVDHLLKALSESDDPVVREVFGTVNPDHVESAIENARNRSFSRKLLFVTRELAEVVVFVLFFLVLIRSFLGEPRLIPSESMLPMLQINDRVIVERVTHWVRPYQRGDVLVFYPPMTQLKNDPWSTFLRLTGFSGLIYKKEDNIDVAYIKRLIGMPGDRIEVRPGVGVFINGQKLDEPYVNEISQSCTLVQPVTLCQPLTVPKDSYFMMGDNRNQSADSRYWGFEPKDRIIGRAVFRIWPVDRFGALPTPTYNTVKNNQ